MNGLVRRFLVVLFIFLVLWPGVYIVALGLATVLGFECPGALWLALFAAILALIAAGVSKS